MRLLAGSLVWIVLAVPLSAEPVKPLTLDVWPGQPPGDKGDLPAEKVTESKPGEKQVKRLTNISKPTLSIFRPAKDKDTGAAVVIAPSGGYNILAWDLEGEEVAAWLNNLGVTGIVLKYRVPRRPDNPKDAPPIQALMDAQRSISLVRSKAKEWGIDPNRVGMLGFSAGGHLTAWTATNFDKRAYEAVDESDKVSCRPDFAVLIYPAYLVGKNLTELSPLIPITKETPPMFFAHAGDDPVRPENSVAMYLALKKAGVPAELHIYSAGGHGFGLRPSDKPASTWPARCGEWLKARKLLETTSSR